MIREAEVICQIWCAYEEREEWEWGKETTIFLSLLLVVHFLQFIITGYGKCAEFPLLVAICHSIYSQLLLFGCPKILCSYSLLGSITAQPPLPRLPPLLFTFHLGSVRCNLCSWVSCLSVCVCVCARWLNKVLQLSVGTLSWGPDVPT